MKRVILFVLLTISIRCMAQQKPLLSGVYHWADVPVTKSEDREGRKFMEGSTAEFEFFEVHASTQFKGAAPRPAHAQKDIEELIFIKKGKVKFTVGETTRVLGKGSLILVPPQQMQAAENVGDGPLTYYVLEFRAKKPMDMVRSEKGGGALLLNADTLKYTPSAVGGTKKYFERP